MKIKAKFSQLLNFTGYDRLIKTNNIEEIARILSNTTYGESGLTQRLLDRLKGIDSQEIDHLMTNDFQKLFSQLANHLPRSTRKFASIFMRKYYYDSIKAIMRGKHLGLTKSEISAFVRSSKTKEMNFLLQLLDFSSISQIIEAIPEAKLRITMQYAFSLFEQSNSTLPLEQAINIFYYTQLWKESKRLGAQIKPALILLGIEVDLINIQTIIRGKLLGLEQEQIRSLLIPIKHRLENLELYLASRPIEILNKLQTTGYREFAEHAQEIFAESAETPVLSAFEALIKQYLVHQALKTFRGVPFHLGIFFAFFILKKAEYENVRAIILGKINELDQDSIKKAIQIW